MCDALIKICVCVCVSVCVCMCKCFGASEHVCVIHS